MNYLRVSILLLVLVITGCVKNQTRLSSPLQVSEFNSLASQYYPRPTFVSLNIHSSGKQSLLVVMDEYGENQYGLKSSMSFGEDHAEDYISMIEKYLEWDDIATKRGDQLDKKIGEASDGTEILTLHFNFFSGNTAQHYMLISNCDLLCADNSSHHYYSKKNALELRSLLTKLKNNELKATDVDEIYK